MDCGRDASAIYRDGKLPGLFYAAPYVVMDPRLCLVACLDNVPCGYILGTANSSKFESWTEKNWFPNLRATHPLPPDNDASADAKLIRLIHAGYHPHPSLSAYPGHLHIDLLPCLQGKGIGRKLIEGFSRLLRQQCCPAMHLGVNERNSNASAFYEHIGLTLLGRHPGWIAYGTTLARSKF